MKRFCVSGCSITEQVQVDRMIKELRLEKHPDGGYYAPSYQSSEKIEAGRSTVSVGYRMLTADRPIVCFHQDHTVTAFYFHLGYPTKLLTINSNGILDSIYLGLDFLGEQCMQTIVPEGSWKALELSVGPFSVISEVNCPGCATELHRRADADLLVAQDPSMRIALARYFYDDRTT